MPPGARYQAEAPPDCRVHCEFPSRRQWTAGNAIVVRAVDALCSTGKQSFRGKSPQNLKSASRSQKYHSSASPSSPNVTPTNLDRIVSVAMAPRQMVKGSPRMVGNAAPCSDVRQGNAGQPDNEKVHSMGHRRPPNLTGCFFSRRGDPLRQ